MAEADTLNAPVSDEPLPKSEQETELETTREIEMETEPEPEVRPVTSLHPGAIRLTLLDIPDRFNNGIPLTETLKHILYGKLKVQDLSPIEVAHVDRQWYVIKGNRRLFLYKLLSQFASHLLHYHHVPVRETIYVPGHKEDTRFLTSTQEYEIFEGELGQELASIISLWKSGPLYRSPSITKREQAVKEKPKSPRKKKAAAAAAAAGSDEGSDDVKWLDMAGNVLWFGGKCFKFLVYCAIFSFLFLYYMSKLYVVQKKNENKTSYLDYEFEL